MAFVYKLFIIMVKKIEESWKTLTRICVTNPFIYFN